MQIRNFVCLFRIWIAVVLLCFKEVFVFTSLYQISWCRLWGWHEKMWKLENGKHHRNYHWFGQKCYSKWQYSYAVTKDGRAFLCSTAKYCVVNNYFGIFYVIWTKYEVDKIEAVTDTAKTWQKWSWSFELWGLLLNVLLKVLLSKQW